MCFRREREPWQWKITQVTYLDLILSNGWNKQRMESMSFIQQPFTKCLPSARSCEESVIVISQECGKWGPEKCNNLPKENQPFKVIFSSETLHMLFPLLDLLFLQVFMWLATFVLQDSAQLSLPHWGPPWLHYSKSPLSSLSHMTLLYYFFIYLTIWNGLILSISHSSPPK